MSVQFDCTLFWVYQLDINYKDFSAGMAAVSSARS
jgi:hypothetical protein